MKRASRLRATFDMKGQNMSTVIEESKDKFAYTSPKDAVLTRCRKCRVGFFLTASALTMASAWFIGKKIGVSISPEATLIHTISGLTGLICGGFAVNELLKLSLVRNTTTQMFLTIDMMRSILHLGNVNIPYGPGLHFSYPWEWRVAENNISLEEASNDFEFSVQCADGTLTGKGSFRLRPDMERPVSFLTGVAAVAGDLTDLIIAEAIVIFARAKVINSTKLIPKLNKELHDKITEGISDFEKRFGVHVGDATVKELLPSDEVQKTISALTEAAAIKKGTALLMNMSISALQKALKNGSVKQNDYNVARDRFMAISGNLEGMDIKRFELDLNASGIDPETAQALTSLARQVVPVVAARSRKGNKK